MTPIKTLLPDLRKLVVELADDLLARSTQSAEIDAGLREAFGQIEKGGRTAQAFEVWRDDYLDQVAVAWVLACVFVRFMEDNHLIDECWLAGEGDRRKLAEDSHEIFFRAHPHDTDREYFQHVFHLVGQIPAAKDLFAEGKTPLWAVAPSGDAAMKLLEFWRERDAATGHLQRSFEVESGDTRFLGDLYQELSERAKKKFALLQTPVFVEEFILDRTLTPALAEFGLEQVRMIDPTCGSGHFLLGGFARLFREWCKRESNEIKAAQNALDGVWGVDINPFAVAIARLRLIVAAVQACGIKRLKHAPGWTIHLATGDSLLFGSRWNRAGEKIVEQGWLASDEESWAPEIFACEDKDVIQDVLSQQYHVVVGNPPYIIVRDRMLNDVYRERYSTCHQKYSLAVPFAERFFDLCLTNGNHKSGYVGMITANSFMKREFGKKLIEEFFPKIDLTHVVDTSGAYIPGHGTPTVILFGRNRNPNGDAVRAVLGIKGEPATPENASQGVVWQSIVKHIDIANAQDDHTSTADVPRTTFNTHPWSIGGGGAAELQEQIEETIHGRMSDFVTSVGFASFPGLDDAFVMSEQSHARKLMPPRLVKSFITGECVRDWQIASVEYALTPYDTENRLIGLEAAEPWVQHLWTVRTCLEGVVSFGGKTRRQLGDDWWGWYRWIPDKYRTPLSITFASVATHNHFVLDRGGRVFNRHAPIIKLLEDANEDDYLSLLGLLNSSTACFWMQQTFHNKGGPGGGSSKDEKWHDFYEFSGTALQRFPVTEEKPLDLSRKLDVLAAQYSSCLPDAITKVGTPTADALFKSRKDAATIRGRMIALQEELDWQSYRLFGLLTEDVCCADNVVAELALGERAFEILMARRIQDESLSTKWFEWLGIRPLTDVPSHWPTAYRKLVEQRINLIESNKEIALIEKPDCKRRWESEAWHEQEQRALKNWLLDRLETQKYRNGTPRHPELTTTAQMADVASADADLLQVAALYRGRPDFNLAALVAELVEGESVPFLPILRYKPTGLRKREVWERTWNLQREEDRLSVEGARSSAAPDSATTGNQQLGTRNFPPIPVPHKYATADFVKTDYWRLRGKLDVPKERWISYPHCQTDSDPTLVVSWAGWNHLEQATALVAYYDLRKREGWDAERLTPLLAGLDQLLPWIHQWHPEIDKEFGETAGQSFQTMLEHDAHELGLTLEDVRKWEPPAKATKARAARKKKTGAEGDA